MTRQPSGVRVEKKHFVSLKSLRIASGKKQADVCLEITKHLGLPAAKPFLEGSLSSIESGKRGASQATLDAIAKAYGLAPGSIRSDYLPQDRQVRKSA